MQRSVAFFIQLHSISVRRKLRKAENLKGNGERTKRRGIYRTECYIVLKGDLRKTKLLKEDFFLTPREPIEASWELSTYKPVRKKREQKCKASMPVANDSCSRHELALAVAPCCSEMSASDAVGSAGTHLECTTETCPGHLRDQTPWPLHSSPVPECQSGAGLVVNMMK